MYVCMYVRSHWPYLRNKHGLSLGNKVTNYFDIGLGREDPCTSVLLANKGMVASTTLLEKLLPYRTVCNVRLCSSRSSVSTDSSQMAFPLQFNSIYY
jgi:hypothetical protein